MSHPLISVITSAFSSPATIERAIRSVVNQTLAGWELLLIDNGSAMVLQEWAERDARIRTIRMKQQADFIASRNLSLKSARGNFVVYLAPDDEFNPNYLERVVSLSTKADLLIFDYDFVNVQPSTDVDFVPREESGVATWEPHRIKDNLFAKPIAALLGIAHRRKLFEKVGGFNELLWEGEEWDFLKRMVRIGVEPLFGERSVNTTSDSGMGIALGEKLF